MNKQELIKKYKRLEGVWDAPGAEIARQIFLQDLEQLDEPQKTVVPQFVADWIKYCKFTNVNLGRALFISDIDFYDYANQEDSSKLKEFLGTETNQELFARAWLDGYEVVKEKRYLVKIKANNQYIMSNPDENAIFFYSIRAYSALTRKQLEDDGFGWVFDCPGIEIQEVTE